MIAFMNHLDIQFTRSRVAVTGKSSSGLDASSSRSLASPLTISPIVKSKQHKTRKSKPGGSYAAKLLFQFRVVVDGSPGIRRLCEERIVTFSAAHGREALREAKRRGRAAQHHYKNNEGNPVHFEFVGVMELLRLDPACEADEAWYEITERVRPMERRASILQPERRLSAIRNDE
jgi:hypothetical protein